MRQKGRAPEELKSVFPLGKSPILVVDSPASSPDQEPFIVVAEHSSNGIWNPAPEDKIRSDYFQEFACATLLRKVDALMYFDIIPPFLPIIVRPFLGPFCNYVASLMKEDSDGPFKLMENALSEKKPLVCWEGCWIGGFLAQLSNGHVRAEEVRARVIALRTPSQAPPRRVLHASKIIIYL